MSAIQEAIRGTLESKCHSLCGNVDHSNGSHHQVVLLNYNETQVSSVPLHSFRPSSSYDGRISPRAKPTETLRYSKRTRSRLSSRVIKASKQTSYCKYTLGGLQDKGILEQRIQMSFVLGLNSTNTKIKTLDKVR